MKWVLLDTNFLIYCFDFKIDIREEISCLFDNSYEIFVLDSVLKELEKLKKKGALTYASRFKILKGLEEKVDEDLVLFSQEGYIIATQDKELKGRLKKPYVIIRQKKYLALVE